MSSIQYGFCMHPFQTVKLDNGAAILLTPCPGTKGDDVASSIAQLKEAGATVLITMMQTEELKKHSVTDIPLECSEQSVAWFHFPVEDDHSPRENTQALIETQKQPLLARLSQGETVAVHCKGGQGRTGLMAAILMLELGYSWAETKQRIQEVKPKSLTLAPHLAYLENYSENYSA